MPEDPDIANTYYDQFAEFEDDSSPGKDSSNGHEASPVRGLGTFGGGRVTERHKPTRLGNTHPARPRRISDKVEEEEEEKEEKEEEEVDSHDDDEDVEYNVSKRVSSFKKEQNSAHFACFHFIVFKCNF